MSRSDGYTRSRVSGATGVARAKGSKGATMRALVSRRFDGWVSANVALAAVAGPPRRWRPHPSNPLLRRRAQWAAPGGLAIIQASPPAAMTRTDSSATWPEAPAQTLAASPSQDGAPGARSAQRQQPEMVRIALAQPEPGIPAKSAAQEASAKEAPPPAAAPREGRSPSDQLQVATAATPVSARPGRQIVLGPGRRLQESRGGPAAGFATPGAGAFGPGPVPGRRRGSVGHPARARASRAVLGPIGGGIQASGDGGPRLQALHRRGPPLTA